MERKHFVPGLYRAKFVGDKRKKVKAEPAVIAKWSRKKSVHHMPNTGLPVTGDISRMDHK